MHDKAADSNLSKQRTSKFFMELLWWAVTAIAAWMATRPFWKYFDNDEYLIELTVYIVVLITVARYLFLLKYTFLARLQALKFILIFASIPLALWGVNEFFDFRDFYETQSEGMIENQSYFEEGLTFSKRYEVLQHLMPIYSFFAWGAIITLFMMPFRLLVSYWRVYNKTGTV